jgi:Co/Zn/Cd efflux system component
MTSCCPCSATFDGASSAYRRTLWLVVVLNAVMFAIETVSGHWAGSQALQADALDFLGDAATYGISLAVIGKPLIWRTRAALLKAGSLGLFGLWVLAATGYRVFADVTPEPMAMGLIGMLALGVNVTAALLLLRFRNGDANVRSVWLCSRNDAIGNLAVVAAASGVWASGSAAPDLAVAFLMAGLFLHSSVRILHQAITEAQVPAAFPDRPAGSCSQ